MDVLLSSPKEVMKYLKKEFVGIVENKNNMQEAIMANLYYETQTERFEMIIGKLKKIIGNY